MHTRFITDERTRIFNNTLHTICRIDGHTEFGGCQCSKDCNCAESFVSIKFTDYRLTRKWGKKKVYTYSFKKDAYKQMRNLTKEHKKLKDEQKAC